MSVICNSGYSLLNAKQPQALARMCNKENTCAQLVGWELVERLQIPEWWSPFHRSRYGNVASKVMALEERALGTC